MKSKIISDNQLIDITGQTFGEWTVLKDVRKDIVLCRCSCGVIREVSKPAVKSGRSKSCGYNFFTENITGKDFYEWHIIKDHGDGIVTAQCSCGLIKENRKHSIVHGISKSCGHSEKMKGQKFGEWEVIEDIENSRKKLCKCSCGTIREIRPILLKTGHTKSCGCKLWEHSKATMLERYGDLASSRIMDPREPWQIEILTDKDKMIEYLNSIGYKPTIHELKQRLNISKGRTRTVIGNMGLDDYIT
jgi:hypothetical protein